MEKRYKYIVPYLSRKLIHLNIYPLRDAAFGADCLTSFKILKIIIIVVLKMVSGNAVKNCYML